MGIDIRATWKGQTEEEEQAQRTGFSIKHGNVGYLREAYHGGPYVTRFLLKEAFESKNAEAKIPAKLLKQRLPSAVLLAIYRDQRVYCEGLNEPGIIDLADKGGAVALATLMTSTFSSIATMKTGEAEEQLAAKISPLQIAEAEKLIATRSLPDVALSFVDFVALCERKEAETGTPCRIIASY